MVLAIFRLDSDGSRLFLFRWGGQRICAVDASSCVTLPSLEPLLLILRGLQYREFHFGDVLVRPCLSPDDPRE
jgi:hypothetical protein